MSHPYRAFAFASVLPAALFVCVEAQVPPPAEPDAFPTASFCETAGSGDALKIPEHVNDVLDDRDGRSDEDVADALLTKAALELAHAAADRIDCVETFERGEWLFLAALETHQDDLQSAGGYRPSRDSVVASVQKQITWFWREDQAARRTLISSGTEDRTGAAFWTARLAAAHTVRMDGRSTRYIESLLDDYAWIDTGRFGSSVSAHAWILIQHADDRPDLQARVLEQMEPYLENGGIKPANYAYLWDRVAVNTGREQRYGTQPTWECTDGKLELQPLEDPETVNGRRAALGMDTVEEGLKKMAESVCL